MEACLDKVIKLSRTTCPCVDEGKPDDFNAGQCDVYLDELEGINLSLISGGSNCEAGNIWDMMTTARENATLAFKADILAKLEESLQPKRPNYSGLLGQRTFANTLTIGQQYAGQKLIFQPIVGGKIRINRIGLIMNASASIQVRVYDNDEHYATPLAAYTINSTAGEVAFGNLTTPLELPMWSRNVLLLRYFFVYTISGFLPKDNKTVCLPCTGGTKMVAWENWLRVVGIKGDDSAYLGYTETQEINGMLLDADLYCDAPRVICSDEHPLDFNSGRAMQMAYAIRFKAGALLLDQILSSGEINRYTLLDREALYGKRNFYRSSYEQWIVYLATNTNLLNHDCWVCREPSLLRRGSILV